MPAGVVLFQAQRFGQLIRDDGLEFVSLAMLLMQTFCSILKSGGTMDLRSRDFSSRCDCGYWGRVAGGLGLQFFIPSETSCSYVSSIG